MSAKFQKPHLLGLTAAAILCLLFSNPVVAGGNPSDEAEAYASQQDNIVKGTVLDERGETLVGVSVIIQGTSIGTATDSPTSVRPDRYFAVKSRVRLIPRL